MRKMNFLIVNCHHNILQGVREVEETWNNMKFNVFAYMKGTSNRGFILGSVDDVLQNLDDSSMNLQVCNKGPVYE